MKPFKSIRFLFTASLLIAVSLAASAQFYTDNGGYGGQTDPNNVVGGRYANQTAVFDSNGVLKGIDAAVFCAACPAPTQWYTQSVTLTNAQLLAIHSTPDTLLRALGTNLAPNLISAYATINYGSAAFASDSILQIFVGGSTANVIAANTELVNQASTSTGRFTLSGGSSFINGGTGYPPNAPLLVTSRSANLTSGTGSTVTITFTYSVMNITTGAPH